MLHIQIDPQSGVPIYRQVMDQVRNYVASGALKPGTQLPSIRELAKNLAVNPTTIVKAYTELEHDRVIEMRQGKGAFLAERGEAPNPEECARKLGVIARKLGVEALQMGISRQNVIKIVESELDRIETGGSLEGDPSKDQLA